MKKVITFTFILVLAGVGIYYFAPSGRPPAKPLVAFDPVEVGEDSAADPGRVLGIQLQEIEGGIHNFASSTGQVLGSAIAGAVQSVKESIVDRVAGALGVSGPEGGFGVCPTHKKDEPVVYLIEFPAAASTTAYSVDWGDGQIINGPIGPESQSILVSHVYDKSGNYIAKFVGLVAGSPKTLAQKEVCVRE
jgi:hypothetical protein